MRIGEDLFHRLVEQGGDAEGEIEGGVVLAALQGVDRLARDPDHTRPVRCDAPVENPPKESRRARSSLRAVRDDDATFDGFRPSPVPSLPPLITSPWAEAAA